jgi:orotate phosphoribosyltransferase
MRQQARPGLSVGERSLCSLPMEGYQRALIDFMLASDVLRFGDFTGKSGRKMPYFIDAGRYRTGMQISRLARFYAQAIRAQLGSDFDVLFGPAYKGIPLAVATAMALHDDHGQEVAYCFNRKEAKDHGEGGVLVGHKPQDGDRVLIIEDVTTAGTSVRESVSLLRAAAKVELVGLVVAVDRRERGHGEQSALKELRDGYDIKTIAIVTIDDIIQHLREHPAGSGAVLTQELQARLAEYRAQYGVNDQD